MRVLKSFKDKNTKIVYRIGDSYSCDDEERIAFLIERGYIEGETKPSIDTAQHNELQLMTKKELLALLKRRGIKHNPNDKKEKLIELLMGGG